MLERVIENWLDKSSERSFEVPFCHMLAAEGHTIIHMTRHSSLEFGKDILTIDKDGKPCAFQLKSAKKISIKEWRKINSQVFDLVTQPIDHPSINTDEHHKSYLVTNGILDEEVSIAINSLNRGWKNKGFPHFKLETIVKGEILKKANNLGTNLWPDELEDIKILVDLMFETGTDPFPISKLSILLEELFTFEKLKNGHSPTKARCGREISSGALLCSLATRSFTEKKNYIAEIEAWILYIAYVLGLATRWNLPSSLWKGEIEIAKKTIYNSLIELYKECESREHFVEGHALVDQPFYNIRFTMIISMLSILGLWRIKNKIEENEIDDFIRKFCLANIDKLYLWGEAATPQLLAFHWYYKTVEATRRPDFLLRDLIKLMCSANKPRGKGRLANPYYGAEEVVSHIEGIAKNPIEESFAGYSYTLESLLHIFVRRNFKQEVKYLWPDFTKLMKVELILNRKWHFFLRRSKSGTQKVSSPNPTQDWNKLRDSALESEGKCIPNLLINEPIILLLILWIYPHRVNSQIVRWLDSIMINQ